jgi:hypothetical protein
MINTNITKRVVGKILGDKHSRNEEEEFLGKRYPCPTCKRRGALGEIPPLKAFKRKGRYVCGEHFMEETAGNTFRGKDD